MKKKYLALQLPIFLGSYVLTKRYLNKKKSTKKTHDYMFHKDDDDYFIIHENGMFEICNDAYKMYGVVLKLTQPVTKKVNYIIIMEDSEQKRFKLIDIHIKAFGDYMQSSYDITVEQLDKALCRLFLQTKTIEEKDDK